MNRNRLQQNEFIFSLAVILLSLAAIAREVMRFLS